MVHQPVRCAYPISLRDLIHKIPYRKPPDDALKDSIINVNKSNRIWEAKNLFLLNGKFDVRREMDCLDDLLTNSR